MAENYLGIDIGSNQIKVVELKKTSNGLILQAYGKTDTPKGASKSESQADIDEIASAVRKLMKEIKATTNKVIVGLPEGLRFSPSR